MARESLHGLPYSVRVPSSSSVSYWIYLEVQSRPRHHYRIHIHLLPRPHLLHSSLDLYGTRNPCRFSLVGKQGRRILSVEAGYHCEFCAKRRRGVFSAGLKTRIKILGEIFSMVNQQRRVRRTSCQNLAYPHGNTKLPRPTLDPGFWVLETNHGVHLRFDHARRERRIWSTVSDLPTYELGPPPARL
jgi:hypothetical protein